MKVKKGMYVRTTFGIEKCVDKYKTSRTIYYDLDDNGVGRAMTEHDLEKVFLNAKKKIVDLLEPQDLMYVDISPDNYGGIVVPRVAETLDELNFYKKRFARGECILKGVVIHELLSECRNNIEE